MGCACCGSLCPGNGPCCCGSKVPDDTPNQINKSIEGTTNKEVKTEIKDVNEEIKSDEKKEDKIDDDIKVEDDDYNAALRLIGDSNPNVDLSNVKTNTSLPSVEDALKHLNSKDTGTQYHAVKKALDKLYRDDIEKQAIAKRIAELKKDRLHLKEQLESDNSSSKSKLPITDYVIQTLQDNIDDPSVHLKAVGSDRGFTDMIKRPDGKNGITLDFTARGYDNPACKHLLDDEKSSFSKTLLSEEGQERLKTHNIGLAEAGCLISTIENYYWEPDADDREVPMKHYHSRHRSNLFDTNGQRYTCLPNRVGYEIISVVGTAQVGAMGYGGLNYEGKGPLPGSLTNNIASVRLLTIENREIKHYQIEPSFKPGLKSSRYPYSGIFDPSSKEKLAELGVELIQDDETFGNVITSVGTYGVITHVYLNLVDSYWLTQIRETIKFDLEHQESWINKYKELYKNPDVFQIEAWLQPYNTKHTKDNKNHIAIMELMFSYWIRVDDKKQLGLRPNTRDEIIQFGGANRNYHEFPSTFITATAGLVQTFANMAHRYKSSSFVDAVGYTLDLALKNVKTLSKAGKSKNIDPNTGKQVDTLTMSCIEALDFGTANLTPNITVGNGFPLDAENDLETSIKIFSGYVNFLHEQGYKNYLCITSPSAFRFSGKSFGNIAIDGTYDAAWIEQVTVTVGQDSIMDSSYKYALNNSISLFKNIRQYFRDAKTSSGENAESRVHYGLWINQDEPDWFNFVPKKLLNSFINDYQNKFNKDGVFANQFTRISKMDPEYVQ